MTIDKGVFKLKKELIDLAHRYKLEEVEKELQGHLEVENLKHEHFLESEKLRHENEMSRWRLQRRDKQRWYDEKKKFFEDKQFVESMKNER